MAQPNLMFCLGATKAGTSWLHRYLSDHPDCHLRGVKEVHYFDALAFDDFDTWIDAAAIRRDAALARATAVTGAARRRQHALAADAEAWRAFLDMRTRDDAAYLDYLETGRGDETLIGDMTPAYALLKQNWLRQMARLRPDVRFIYLLRDPVDRLWSHCRMMAKRRAVTPDEVPGRAINILRRVHKGKENEIVRRCDYRGPLKRLQAAIDPANWQVFFYEDLFKAETVAAICRFLGISTAPANFEKRVMSGPQVDMLPGQFETAHDWLRPQYEFVAATFGRVPAAWQHDLKEVRP